MNASTNADDASSNAGAPASEPDATVAPNTDASEPATFSVSRRTLLGAIGLGAAVASLPVGSASAARKVKAVKVKSSPASSTAPSAPASTAPAPAVAGVSTVPSGSGTLVLLTLYGGNDGINTLVPYADSAYAAARGALAYTPDQVIQLDGQFGLNPTMTGLKAMWDAKRVAIVRGVGYPNPNRSHFRSMDIWQTGIADGVEATGWLGRWHDATGPDPLRMISIGPSLPRAMLGLKGSGAAIPNGQITLPGSAALASAFAELHRAGAGAELGILGNRLGASGSDLLRVQSSLGSILAGGSQGVSATSLEGGATAYGDRSELDDQLDEVRTLIKGGATARAYSVSLGGFDTHATERDQHERLLGAVDKAISRFFTALSGDRRGDGVTMLVYSEFGRRVGSNSTAGTDHGTAAPTLVIGPQVKGGFYGDPPSLTDLDQGDLKFTTDFRSIYATLLGSVLGIEPAAVLGKPFAPVPFL